MIKDLIVIISHEYAYTNIVLSPLLESTSIILFLRELDQLKCRLNITDGDSVLEEYWIHLCHWGVE